MAIWIMDIVWHYEKLLQVSLSCQGIDSNKTDSSAKNKVHKVDKVYENLL